MYHDIPLISKLPLIPEALHRVWKFTAKLQRRSSFLCALLACGYGLGGQIPVKNVELAVWEDCCLDIFGMKGGEGRVVVVVPERSRSCHLAAMTGRDLNADGDSVDHVLHVYDLVKGETTNLEHAVSRSILLRGSLIDPTEGFSISGRWLAYALSEANQFGQDLNGDGDTADDVLHLLDLDGGEPVNLGFAVWRLVVSGKWLVFSVPETDQAAQDLNGDGDLGEDRDGNGSIDHERSITESDVILYSINLDTGALSNLGIDSTTRPRVSGDWLVLADPRLQAQNLSSGERIDLLGGTGSPEIVALLEKRVIIYNWTSGDLQVHDLETREATKLDMGPDTCHFGLVAAHNRVAFRVRERADLDDAEGCVVHIYDLEKRERTNTGLTGRPHLLSENWLVVRGTSHGVGMTARHVETGETVPLVGWPDAIADHTLFVIQDDDGDGAGALHIMDLQAGLTIDSGITTKRLWRRETWHTWNSHTAFLVYERPLDVDLNGDEDAEDLVLHVADLSVLAIDIGFIRGDCNDDGTVDISDAVFTLGSLFLGEGDPGCGDACDANDDGAMDISDAIRTLAVLFLGNGAVPLEAKPDCAVDSTTDAIGCERYEGCR